MRGAHDVSAHAPAPPGMSGATGLTGAHLSLNKMNASGMRGLRSHVPRRRTGRTGTAPGAWRPAIRGDRHQCGSQPLRRPTLKRHREHQLSTVCAMSACNRRRSSHHRWTTLNSTGIVRLQDNTWPRRSTTARSRRCGRRESSGTRLRRSRRRGVKTVLGSSSSSSSSRHG